MNYFLVFLSLVTLVSCTKNTDASGSSASETYTLYRGGAWNKGLRMNYAYFNTSGEDSSYNKSNCELVAELVNSTQNRQLNAVKYWCEKGPFKE